MLIITNSLEEIDFNSTFGNPTYPSSLSNDDIFQNHVTVLKRQWEE